MTQVNCLIHPTAIVAPGAELGEGTTVGPYSVIGPNVKIGRANRISSHVVVEGYTTIGDENQLFQFASIGAAPQDLKYRGEPSTLSLGNKNIIREYVTLQPGTSGGGMKTVIGDKNLFMANSHAGHDAIIGSGNVIANSCALAGHITVGNHCVLGGLTAVHQFCRLGDYCLLGGGAMVAQDIPPFCIAQGDRAKLVGINVIGLERHGVSKEEIAAIKAVYRSIFLRKGRRSDLLASARAEYGTLPRALEFIDFCAGAAHGLATPRRSGSDSEEA